jgi:hypothetical protein
MNPRHHHSPGADSTRKRCPICDSPVYSSAGIHPQCAIKQNEGPASVEKVQKPLADEPEPVLTASKPEPKTQSKAKVASSDAKSTAAAVTVKAAKSVKAVGR